MTTLDAMSDYILERSNLYEKQAEYHKRHAESHANAHRKLLAKSHIKRMNAWMRRARRTRMMVNRISEWNDKLESPSEILVGESPPGDIHSEVDSLLEEKGLS